MRQLLLFIAVLLTLANVVSPAVAASIIANPAATVVALRDEGICQAPSAEFHPKPAFKACSKKVNGKALPCHWPPSIMPVAQGSAFGALRHYWTRSAQSGVKTEVFAGKFRPPRSAVA